MNLTNKVREKIIKYEKSIGAVGAIVAIAMISSIVEIMISNLRGNTVIVVQPTATLLSGLVWSLYGYGKKDFFILIPNILACILGTLTIASAFV